MTKITSAARNKVLESVSVGQVVMPQYARREQAVYAVQGALFRKAPPNEGGGDSRRQEWSADFGKRGWRVNRRRTDGLRRGRGERFFSGDICDPRRNEIFPGDAEDARQTELLRAGDRLRRAESAVSRRIVDVSGVF